jgi:SAM-dependent methyltransferase
LGVTGSIEWEGGVGRTWAAEWQRTDRSFAPLTARLLEAIAPLPGSSIVDIGCGAGELSLALAAARPHAEVLGLDISPDLVEVASRRAEPQNNCRFVLGDAASWKPAGAAPDLYVSRHGVMFFADPVAAFAHLAAVAGAGAALCFSCFRSPAENPWASGIAKLLPATPPGDPFAPGPFAFADPDRVRSILASSGWGEPELEAVDFRYVAGRSPDAVAEACDFFSRIGPAARAMREMPGAEREAFRERLRGFVAERSADGEVAFPAAAWIVTARRAG